MLGQRESQMESWGGGPSYLDHVGRDSFYGFLATQRLFRDEDFAALYWGLSR